VFLNGLELANGFHELSDAKEQYGRFETDRKQRKTAQLPDMKIDSRLISALESGLPDCSGVAVGLDRVMMAAGNYTRISETMSFLPAG
jgi:lysyl-tRNA synthetase class 2